VINALYLGFQHNLIRAEAVAASWRRLEWHGPGASWVVQQ
jgi:hypothetical protein